MFLRNCWYVAAWDAEVGEGLGVHSAGGLVRQPAGIGGQRAVGTGERRALYAPPPARPQGDQRGLGHPAEDGEPRRRACRRHDRA